MQRTVRAMSAVSVIASVALMWTLVNATALQQDVSQQALRPNLCSEAAASGLLTITIVGQATFDVLQIDPASVRLQGVAPRRSAIVDSYESSCATGPDGHPDLLLAFASDEIVASIDPSISVGTHVLVLTGRLREEAGGGAIVGDGFVTLKTDIVASQAPSLLGLTDNPQVMQSGAASDQSGQTDLITLAAICGPRFCAIENRKYQACVGLADTVYHDAVKAAETELDNQIQFLKKELEAAEEVARRAYHLAHDACVFLWKDNGDLAACNNVAGGLRDAAFALAHETYFIANALARSFLAGQLGNPLNPVIPAPFKIQRTWSKNTCLTNAKAACGNFGESGCGPITP